MHLASEEGHVIDGDGQVAERGESILGLAPAFFAKMSLDTDGIVGREFFMRVGYAGFIDRNIEVGETLEHGGAYASETEVPVDEFGGILVGRLSEKSGIKYYLQGYYDYGP